MVYGNDCGVEFIKGIRIIQNRLSASDSASERLDTFVDSLEATGFRGMDALDSEQAFKTWWNANYDEYVPFMIKLRQAEYFWALKADRSISIDSIAKVLAVHKKTIETLYYSMGLMVHGAMMS